MGGRSSLIEGYAFVAGGYFVTIMSFAMIYAVFIIGLNIFKNLKQTCEIGKVTSTQISIWKKFGKTMLTSISLPVNNPMHLIPFRQ